MGFNGIYPLVICYVAIEHGPIEIVDFPINSMVIFQFAMLNYQRVSTYGGDAGDQWY